MHVKWGEVAGGWRSAIRAEHIEGLELAGVTCRQAPGADDEPAIQLAAVARAFVTSCRAEPGTGTFLSIEDSEVSCCGNSLGDALRAVHEVYPEPRS